MMKTPLVAVLILYFLAAAEAESSYITWSQKICCYSFDKWNNHEISQCFFLKKWSLQFKQQLDFVKQSAVNAVIMIFQNSQCWHHWHFHIAWMWEKVRNRYLGCARFVKILLNSRYTGSRLQRALLMLEKVLAVAGCSLQPNFLTLRSILWAHFKFQQKKHTPVTLVLIQ